MRWLCYVLVNIFFVVDSYDTALRKHVPGYSEMMIRYPKKKYQNLLLRRVICLGNEDEAVEAVCCSGPKSTTWMVVLPTRRKVDCKVQDCPYVCRSAIIAYRYRRMHIKSTPTINENASATTNCNSITHKIISVQNLRNDFDSNENVREQQMFSTISSPRKFTSVSENKTSIIKVPKIVLDLLQLCGTINNSEYFNNEELKNLCRLVPISFEEIIKKLCYYSFPNASLAEKTAETTKLCLEPTNFSTTCKLSTTPEIKTTCFEKNSSPQGSLNTENVCSLEFKSRTDNTELCSEIMLDKNVELLKANCTVTDTSLTNCKLNEETVTNRLIPTSFMVNKEASVHEVVQEKLPLEILQLIINNDLNQLPFQKPDMGLVPNIPFTSKNSSTADPSCCCNCHKNLTKYLDIIALNKILTRILGFPKLCQVPETYTQRPQSSTDNNSKLSGVYKAGALIEHYISNINNKYMQVYRRYKQAQWNYETNINHYTRQKVMEESLELSLFQKNMNKVLESLSNTSIKDRALERQIKLLYMPGMSLLPDLQRNELEQVIYAMQAIYTSAYINKWKEANEKVNLDPVIFQTMASSGNPDELKYYWIEWRKATGKRIRPLFEQYVSLMKTTAKKNGFHDASEMWTRRYETEDFVESLSSLWEEIRPFYKQLHAFVRHQLHEYYGDSVGAKDSGKIPAHITGDIWGESWLNLHQKVSPFKTRNDFTEKIINKFRKKKSPIEIAKAVEKTFHSLGFSEFPQSFWRNSLFVKKNGTVMNCEPSAWNMYNGTDFRIKMCMKSNVEDILEIHHQMAICEYYKEFNNLEFAFQDEANPGFFKGIAGAIVLAAKTPAHMKLLNLPHGSTNHESEMNEMMKMALDKVAFLSYSYILDLWRHKVFRGEIDSSNYNTKWWELRSRYQGVVPPDKRTEEDFDIGSKLHIVANKPYIKYFVSTIMEFQIYEALCKKANHHGPIHRCDFTNSHTAGKTLRKVMGMGASEHWRVALEEITGIRRLDSTPLLHYFEPLNKWLRDKNKENKVTSGWEDQ